MVRRACWPARHGSCWRSLSDGVRSPLVRRISAPACIGRGQDDPLVPVAAAQDLAADICEARVDIVRHGSRPAARAAISAGGGHRRRCGAQRSLITISAWRRCVAPMMHRDDLLASSNWAAVPGEMGRGDAPSLRRINELLASKGAAPTKIFEGSSPLGGGSLGNSHTASICRDLASPHQS